jgi:mannose-6-phosphate isomerase
MPAYYPLRFEPLFRRYIWGGFRLRDVLSKSIGDESAAESWEVVDHDEDQSVVRFGQLAGKNLRQLIADDGVGLLGEQLALQLASPAIPTQLQNRFPLLIKFLDANRDLSIQVHPDDAFGSTLTPPDLGKTEAWYVMHAEPGSKIYAGLKSGVDCDAFSAAVESGQTESVMHSFEPTAGDCVFIKAGTMHAIGAGLLIAEIQQASDTTFRICDWGRVGDDGKPRDLHIEQGIKATDFHRGPVQPETPSSGSENGQTLIECDKFFIRKHSLQAGGIDEVTVGGDDRFRIIAVTSGEVELSGDPSGQPMRIADTALLPAALSGTRIQTESSVELLEIFVP